MAMLRKQSIPPDAREAYYIVETGAQPSLTELDNMPQMLIEKILAYNAVKNVVIYGGEVNLG